MSRLVCTVWSAFSVLWPPAAALARWYGGVPLGWGSSNLRSNWQSSHLARAGWYWWLMYPILSLIQFSSDANIGTVGDAYPPISWSSESTLEEKPVLSDPTSQSRRLIDQTALWQGRNRLWEQPYELVLDPALGEPIYSWERSGHNQGTTSSQEGWNNDEVRCGFDRTSREVLDKIGWCRISLPSKLLLGHACTLLPWPRTIHQIGIQDERGSMREMNINVRIVIEEVKIYKPII
jgi:hypothetical protein